MAHHNNPYALYEYREEDIAKSFDPTKLSSTFDPQVPELPCMEAAVAWVDRSGNQAFAECHLNEDTDSPNGLGWCVTVYEHGSEGWAEDDGGEYWGYQSAWECIDDAARAPHELLADAVKLMVDPRAVNEILDCGLDGKLTSEQLIGLVEPLSDKERGSCQKPCEIERWQGVQWWRYNKGVGNIGAAGENLGCEPVGMFVYPSGEDGLYVAMDVSEAPIAQEEKMPAVIDRPTTFMGCMGWLANRCAESVRNGSRDDLDGSNAIG